MLRLAYSSKFAVQVPQPMQQPIIVLAIVPMTNLLMSILAVQAVVIPETSSLCLLAIPRISAWTIRKNPEKHFGHWSTSIQALPLLPCQFGSTECYGLCKTAANLPDAAQQSSLFRLCRVWLRPGLTGMLVRCMLSGTRFVVSAPKHKRKHSPTRLPDRLGYRLHRECNAVPERTFVSGNYSRCPPPAAWRLSHRVAECAEV